MLLQFPARWTSDWVGRPPPRPDPDRQLDSSLSPRSRPGGAVEQKSDIISTPNERSAIAAVASSLSLYRSLSLSLALSSFPRTDRAESWAKNAERRAVAQESLQDSNKTGQVRGFSHGLALFCRKSAGAVAESSVSASKQRGWAGGRGLARREKPCTAPPRDPAPHALQKPHRAEPTGCTEHSLMDSCCLLPLPNARGYNLVTPCRVATRPDTRHVRRGSLTKRGSA